MTHTPRHLRNLNDWWTKETRAAFEDSQKCFVDQFDAFEFKDLEKLRPR